MKLNNRESHPNSRAVSERVQMFTRVQLEGKITPFWVYLGLQEFTFCCLAETKM